MLHRRIAILATGLLAFACRSYFKPAPVAVTPQCRRGALGIEPLDISRAMRTSMHLAADLTGTVVGAVMPGSPAELGGVKANDIVTRIGGKAITNTCEFIDEGFSRRSCDPVSITFLRGGEMHEVTVTPVDQFSFYKRACDRGSDTGCFRYGWIVWAGAGTQKNEEEAIGIYRIGCERGVAEACAYGGLHLSERPDPPKTEVIYMLTRGCDLGSSASCAHLAYMYATGTLVAHDDARATPLYVKSCDLGDPRGCYNVGLMYEDGRGVATDISRAVAAYDEGCRGGSSTACTNLGYYYENGKGVPKDEKKAVALYKLGCDGTSCQPSNLRGCVNLGRAYRDGIGVEKDSGQAAKIFEAACSGNTDEDDVNADENQSRACALLGALYLVGDGVETDLEAGLNLSEQACRDNDAFGCFNAARVWANGLGVERDMHRAASYYDSACEAGDGEGCYELSRLYLDGNGVTADRGRADALVRKACELGYQKACGRG